MGHSHHHEHDHAGHDHPPAKSRAWLFRGALGNLFLGVVQLTAGVAGGSNALVSEGLHNAIDSAGYTLNHRAASHEHNGDTERAKRINRAAGRLICIAAAAVMAQSMYELAGDASTADPSAFEQAVMYGGAGLNIAVATGLSPDSHEGGAHRMGWLHAASDISGSVINGLGMFLSARGVAQADQLAAVASSAVYIAFNYPTEARITHGH